MKRIFLYNLILFLSLVLLSQNGFTGIINELQNLEVSSLEQTILTKCFDNKKEFQKSINLESYFLGLSYSIELVQSAFNNQLHRASHYYSQYNGYSPALWNFLNNVKIQDSIRKCLGKDYKYFRTSAELHHFSGKVAGIVLSLYFLTKVLKYSYQFIQMITKPLLKNLPFLYNSRVQAILKTLGISYLISEIYHSYNQYKIDELEQFQISEKNKERNYTEASSMLEGFKKAIDNLDNEDYQKSEIFKISIHNAHQIVFEMENRDLSHNEIKLICQTVKLNLGCDDIDQLLMLIKN